MSDQREFWNERFIREGYFYGEEPNRYVASLIDTLSPAQNILFLGEGEGRNAVYAAQKGHRVTALDASEIGLAKCAYKAQQQDLKINLIHTDLEMWNPAETYDAILCSFLHLSEPLRSSIFTLAVAHLQHGGIFGGEFFSQDQFSKPTGGPKDLNLLYRAKDLENILTGLPCSLLELSEMDTVLSEGKGHQGLASVLRMCVRRS